MQSVWLHAAAMIRVRALSVRAPLMILLLLVARGADAHDARRAPGGPPTARPIWRAPATPDIQSWPDVRWREPRVTAVMGVRG